MDITILISFIKELSAEVSLTKIKRFIVAFLSNFFPGYLNFDVYLGLSEGKIKNLYRGETPEDEKNKKIFFEIKNTQFFNLKKELKGYIPHNPRAKYIFYYPFYRFKNFFGFMVIEFEKKLTKRKINSLEILSSFLGSIFLSSYLYEKERKSQRMFKMSYDLSLISTRIFEREKIIQIFLDKICDELYDVEGAIFYELRGNVLVPIRKSGKVVSEILNIEKSFPGKALLKMETVHEKEEFSCLVPTKDFIHGILYVKKRKGSFDEEEVKTIELISNTLSVAIENANFIKEIRERKESLEEEVRKLIEKEREEERLALIGRIATSIVHELKNLIAGIINVSEIIEIKERDEVTLKLTKAMREEAEMMHYLLISLLETAKPFSLNIKECRLLDIINKVMDLSKFFIKKKKIDILNKVSYDEIKLLCDKVKFELALLNIIKNSIEAIEDGGKIEIDAVMNDKFILKIKDTGKGIDKSELDKIFEPFYSKKEKGIGLGLSFVKRVMEAHGFNVKVSSIIGKGTEFYIEIPLDFIKGSIPDKNKI